MTTSRLLAFAVFFLFLMTLSVLGHIFIQRVLRRNLGLHQKLHAPMKAALIALGAGGPLSYVVYRFFPASAPVVSVLVTWMGFSLILTLTLVAHDIAPNLKFRSTKGEVDTGRRLFLTRSTSAAALFGAGGVGSYGINVAVSGPPVHDVEVALKKWPAELAGFRIAQISDLHVGPSIRLPYVQDVVTKINALDADLVVLTGDIVDGTIDFLREHVQPLSQLKAKHGVYMVTGNHEYYAGAVPWVEEFTRMGIRVLRNENLKIETGGQAFNLAGVDDYLSEGMAPGHGFDLEGTLRGRDPSLATVLLAHQPRGFIEAVSLGVDLQLSGHTHGGQIWPFALFISFVQPYVKGLHKLGDSHIYVSCGTGYWGPAMRVNAPSEITHFKLIPEKA